jgi:hypothetical protein
MKTISKIIGVLIFFCLINSGCSLFLSFPPSVKNLLETADKIELIADADKKDGKIVYRGDDIKVESLKAIITNDATKKNIVQSFQADTGGNGDAKCFNPRHILRATKGEKIVDIEICYECDRFEINGSLGEFSGGLSSKSSEATLNQILFEKGVETK